jgi:hypothetical protein
VAVETAGVSPAEVGRADAEPVGAEDADPDGDGAAGAARRGVEEGGVVVPLVVVEGRVGGELVAGDVEVAAARPVVLEVGEGRGSPGPASRGTAGARESGWGHRRRRLGFAGGRRGRGGGGRRWG